MTYCIEPMTVSEVQVLLGKNFAETFQTEMDLIVSPLRKYIDKGFPLALGKEQWEYVVTESIPNAVWCGAGKSLIDVSIGDNKGIDVKGVGRGKKSKFTAEASMYQCFDQSAKTFFKNQDSQSLWKLYVDGWVDKAKSFDEYYLVAIIREKETLNCSVCCFKISDARPVYSEENCKFNKCSVMISGIADPDFIKVRYYNSKSRLEILFQQKCWNDPNYSFPIYQGIK
jgi:hypothetical protein